MVFIISSVELRYNLYANNSFDEFYEAKNDSKYLAKYSITDKTDASRDFISEKFTSQLSSLFKKLDSVLKKDALGPFSNQFRC